MDMRLQYDASNALASLEVARSAIRRAMLAAGEDATSLWLVQMRRYPPPIALRVSISASGRRRDRLGNGYRRTGTLRKSWFAKPPRAEGRGVVAEVVSSGQIAPYNIYVQMEGVQAWMHAGRWETEAQVIERTRAQVAQMAQRRTGDALRTVR
jgi:hypothetical protein